MNTRASKSVLDTSTRQRRPLGALFAACSLFYVLQSIQCVGIDGGASELTWSLRTFRGESSGCEESRVEMIRLCWNAGAEGDTGCRPGNFRDFACLEETGVTLFEIAPGPTRFFVQPICLDGAAAQTGTFQVPPEIVRNVREGEVVTLEALLIVVTDPDTCRGAECTCVRP